MWFVLLAIALGLVGVGGWYFRRRILEAGETFAISRRKRRLLGWLIPWLLYGYPTIVFGAVFSSIALGSESISRTPTGVWEWVLVHPFWLAVLVTLQAVPLFLAIDVGSLLLRRRAPRDRIRRLRAIAFAVVTSFFLLYTPGRIIADRHDLQLRRWPVGERGADGPDLKIVFLADLQQDSHTDRARVDQVIDLVNRENADLILAGGDWINSGPNYIERAARSAGRLRSRLGASSVRGDHEHFAYRDQERSVTEITAALEANGVRMLDNEIRRVEHQGKSIAIIHLSYNYLYRTPDREIDALLAEVEDDDYAVLVAHQFDEHLADIVGGRVDLALVGHTHGGQVNLILGFVHVAIARIETPFVSGRYQLGDRTTLVVTSGIGFSIAPFRYASPATVEVIELSL